MIKKKFMGSKIKTNNVYGIFIIIGSKLKYDIIFMTLM
jgi:hypothetical protein